SDGRTGSCQGTEARRLAWCLSSGDLYNLTVGVAKAVAPTCLDGDDMAQMLPDRYRRWFEYEKDSHAKVLASLEAVPAGLRSSPAFAKAVTLLGHIAAARQLWLFRFGVAGERPSDFFPTGLSLAEVATRIGAVQAA